MCRFVVIPKSPVEEGEGEDEEDDYSLDSSDEEIDSFYSEDIRTDEEEQENHLLRGVRWLFQQQEPPQPSILDGNSMAITPVSVRRRIEESFDTYEDEEEEVEVQWHDTERRYKETEDKVFELSQFLRERNISYEKLASAFVYLRFPEEFDFLEIRDNAMKIEDILSTKIEVTAEHAEQPIE
jgi:hypothetical protein